jgi:hypothetical protein
LEKVHNLLTQELSTAELSHHNRLHRVERLRNIIGGAAFATIAITLLVVFIREIKANIEKGSPELWPVVIGLVIIVGTIIALSLTIYSATLREKSGGRRMKDGVGSLDATATRELADERDYVEIGSVTEGTTEILEGDESKESKEE